MNNLWASEDELSSKNEAEVKNLLIEKLNFYFDGEIHSIGLTYQYKNSYFERDLSSGPEYERNKRRQG